MMFTTAKTRSRGISIIEILVALGVLVVFLSFATPALRSATTHTELRAAVENLEFSVRMARNTARQLETDVIMYFDADPDAERHSVTFSFPAKKVRPESASLLQDFQFSPGIRLLSDTPSVHFDSRGMPDSAVQVYLVSNDDDEVNQILMIE